jgi:tRNA A-37 threonylcarbamoyl transferase component Bud32
MTPTEDANPQEIDTLLGKLVAGNFRIGRLIGSGAMGNVYQAEQLSLGKAVAIKILHPHLMSDEKLVLRFQREAKSASRLNHPNSIQIIDSGVDSSGALYIAMELLSGRDLSQVIRDEFPLPVPRIVRIMSQVLSALDEAHAQGVIHRDLKPSNIVLTERRGEPDFVKVCDYGIAKAQSDDGQPDSQMLTMQGLVCGTPEYMSPEQARGELLDGRTDLYSAAVILYQMVTGDIPFRASTPIGIVSRHLSETPAVPSARRQDPTIPAELDDLILRGLAKSRNLRPPTAAAFRAELEDIGAGRAGRRLRGAENTVPANQAFTSAGLTVQVPLRPFATRGRGRSGGHRAARALALSLVLGALAAAATLVVVKRSRLSVSAPGAAPAATAASPAAVTTAGAAPSLQPSAQPTTESATQPTTEPTTEPEAEARAIPVVPAPVKPSRSAGDSREHPGRRKRDEARPLAAPAPAAATAVSAGAAAASSPAAPAAPPSATAPPPVLVPASATTVPDTAAGRADDKGTASVSLRTPLGTIGEAEKLLSQGEVAEACQRGEDAKKAAPRLAPAYKFLGKCYMRAGDPTRAKENYRRYLEIFPTAPDAMFIESIVK